MAKLNHNRPHLKIVDNLRRVLAAADSCYTSSRHSIEAITAGADIGNLKEPNPARKSKQDVMIEFQPNEFPLCQELLDSIESYHDCFEAFLGGFMAKSKNKANRKNKLLQSEANLRACIREFFTEYVLVKINKTENSGLPKFLKLLEKGLKKSRFVYDIIADEVEKMNVAIESGSMDQRLTQTLDPQA